MSEFGRAALAYAAHGWLVFPLHGQVPWIKREDGGQGFKDATRDRDQIIRWWTSWPTANVGIRTGQASGLAVLDVDTEAPADRCHPALAEVEAERGLLPGTVMEHTGRGGLHLLYRWAAGLKIGSNVWGKGLDLRGEGGYICAAPSISSKTGRRYEWIGGCWDAPLPRWPTRQLPIPASEEPVRRSVAISRPPAGTPLAGLVNAVLAAEPGKRNHMLNWAAFRAGEHVMAGRMDYDEVCSALLDAGQDVGLTDREIVGTVRSGLAKGMGRE